ncbi:MAG: SurA N-terminal domain-containing protein [Alphaproteobacteria bacterium]
MPAALVGGLGAAVIGVFLAVSNPAPAQAQASLAAVVNDQPISTFDVSQRAKFYRATGAKTGLASLKKQALKEIVEEALMRQEAKRLSISVTDKAVTAAIDARLKRNKRNYSWFKKYLSGRGVRIKTLENRLRAQIGWRQVVQRTYRDLVSIGEADIDAAASKLKSSSKSANDVYSLRRIVLGFAKGASQDVVSSRLADAAKIRKTFRNCDRLNTTLKPFAKVSVKALEKATPKSLKEPLRSLVANAKEGDIIPPDITDTGVVLIAVCSRGAGGGSREIAQRQLISQEFSMLSDRHLRDLKQDALIDYR